MKKIYVIIIAFSINLPLLQAQETNVSAYLAGAYQPGLLNVRDLAAVGAGIYFLDYNYWNNSNSYYDRNGNEVSGLRL